jgi:hypothetical protein
MRVMGLLVVLFRKSCDALQWPSMIRFVAFMGEMDEKEVSIKTITVKETLGRSGLVAIVLTRK